MSQRGSFITNFIYDNASNINEYKKILEKYYDNVVLIHGHIIAGYIKYGCEADLYSEVKDHVKRRLCKKIKKLNGYVFILYIINDYDDVCNCYKLNN